MYVPYDYRIAILECLGGDKLSRLSFERCDDIDPIAELLPFSQLKTLRIVDCSFIIIPVDDDKVVERVVNSGDPFLLKLESLSITSTCVGEWSRLFWSRRRPLLTKLNLHCLHTGPTSMNGFNWNDLSSLAPNLRQIGISITRRRQSLDSIVSHLSSIISRSSSFQSSMTTIPKSVTSCLWMC